MYDDCWGRGKDEPGIKIVGDLESTQLYEAMYLASLMTGASSSVSKVFTTMLSTTSPKGLVAGGGGDGAHLVGGCRCHCDARAPHISLVR